MPTLDSFNNSQGVSLDSFQFQGSAPKIDVPKSNKHLAAQVAALKGGGEVTETYMAAADQMDMEGRSALADNIQQQAQQESFDRAQQDVVNALADPELSDEQRQNLISNYMDMQNERYSLSNMISEKALLKDSGDESYESENARIDLAGSIEAINQSKRAVQNILNREMAQSEESFTGTLADLAELMAPYAESTQVARMVKRLRNGDNGAIPEALTMMGSTRAEMRETLLRTPVENRPAIAEKLAQVINQSDRLLVQDQNDMSRLNNLRAALEDDYYGTEEEWVDNAVGWLDLATLGYPVASTVVRGIRGARAQRAANRAARQAFDGVDDSADQVADTFGDLDGAESAEAQKGGTDILRQQEDEAQQRQQAQRAAFENDPVRRGEDFAERQAEARRAVYTPDDTLADMEDAASEVRKRAVKTSVEPASVSQNFKDTNPTMARAANEVAGQSEEGAEALYGTNRTEALANDELSEFQSADGSVVNKVSLPDRSGVKTPKANPRIMDFMDSFGAVHMTDSEKLSAATRVVNDFNNAMGVVTRKEMNVPSSRDIGSGFDVNVTYGPKDNGWRNGQEALDLLEFSLRDYAVNADDITLLRRNGDRYEPWDKARANEDGDYLAQVKYNYRVADKDVEDWDDLDVYYNFFDRRPHLETKGGSFQRHLLDAASMLDPTLTKGAAASVSRSAAIEKGLLGTVESFGKKMRGLSKKDRSLVDQVIKKQNLESRVLTKSELWSMGLRDDAESALQSWKEAWDNFYWLENRDLARSLINRGFNILEDSSTGSKLIGKSVARNRVGDNRKAYDLAQGKFVTLSPDEVRDLYDNGGSFFTLRSKVDEGGEQIDQVIARNQPGSSYVRSIRNDETVLNYREGYYKVEYTAPKFVDKVVRDESGNVLYRQAVATAGDVREANLYAERMRASSGGEFVVRDNKRRMQIGSDDDWDLKTASGRSSQRFRGERLEDADSPIQSASSNHLMGPVDSAIVAARSLSTRVGMRDFLETTKARAINQYGRDHFPKNEFGQPVFPGHSSKVINEGQMGSKSAADARTTVEYINYLEHGYQNALDDGIKSVLSILADVLGTRGLTRAERGVRAASNTAAPTAIGKSLSYTLYLALHPLRQFVVQAHQMAQLGAIDPQYVGSRLGGDMAAITSKLLAKGGPVNQNILSMAGRSQEEVEDMYQALQSSGILAQIDKSSLVRGSLTQLAEDSRIGGNKNFVSRGISGVRKAGFDKGEEINQLTAFLTFYNREKTRAGGRKLTKSEVDNATGEAINYTYNMNRAGDMPYNENSLGLIFQFMQVPHKAMTQMLFNRTLTPRQKVQLAGFNALMYGAPTSGVVYSAFGDLLPEDGEVREMMVKGLESYTLNTMISWISGEETDIDFQSSLMPADGRGLYQFVTDMMTTDPGSMLAATPSGSLFFGNNPRITNMATSAARMFRFTEPADPHADTTTEFLRSVADLTSGTSSLMKAIIMRNKRQVISQTGDVIDENVSSPEVMAQLFGMQTSDVTRFWEVTLDEYEASEDFEKDLRTWYNNLKRTLTREGITNDEWDYHVRVNNAVAEVFKGRPAAMDFIRQQMKYDVEAGDISLQKSIINRAGYDPEGAREMLTNAPNMTPEEREAMRERLDLFDRVAKESEM